MNLLYKIKKNRWIVRIAVSIIPLVTVGCTSNHLNIKKVANNQVTKMTAPSLTERQCLMRAMYFESNRSSREGMIAVGTVVMNRVNSSAYPKTICGVVGQPKQFAPGVLTRPMTEKASVARVKEAADAVLRGERDKKSKNAMFFHTAGLSFPYKNMHYVRVAGGNAFYEKRARDGSLQVPVNDRPYNVAFAFAQDQGDVSNFIDMGLKNKGIKVEEIQIASASIEVAQVNSIPFVVTKPDMVPIPTPAPNRIAKIQETTPVIAYTVPSVDKLNTVVAMLEKQYRAR